MIKQFFILLFCLSILTLGLRSSVYALVGNNWQEKVELSQELPEEESESSEDEVKDCESEWIEDLLSKQSIFFKRQTKSRNPFPFIDYGIRYLEVNTPPPERMND